MSSATAGKGVVSAHDCFQALIQNMGVDLGRRDIGMAEHFLYRAEIRAMCQQVAREGMAQDVGRNLIG